MFQPGERDFDEDNGIHLRTHRAANDVERLTAFEKSRLLERGLSITRALRNLVLKTGKVAPITVAGDRLLAGVADKLETISDDIVARSLIALAVELRKLRILNAG